MSEIERDSTPMTDDEKAIFVCHLRPHLRPARRRAREIACEEILSLLRDLHSVVLSEGPLAEQDDVFYIALPAAVLHTALVRLPCLGYTGAVDLLELVSEQQLSLCGGNAGGHASVALETGMYAVPPLCWQQKTYQLARIYEEGTLFPRKTVAKRETRESVGTYGNRFSASPIPATLPAPSAPSASSVSSTSNSRMLATYDARMLVNLVVVGESTLFLDPFAGAGSLVIEALARGCTVFSIDIDAALRHGLAKLGAHHQVADACRLPFATGTFDAIATELPYHEETHSVVLTALAEMNRVLKPGGRLAMFSSVAQLRAVRQQAYTLGLRLYLDVPIERAGQDVAVLALQKEGAGL